MKFTIEQFKDFVGETIFTAVFRKQNGDIRKMNARLKVAKFVKGTQPDVTAKRKATLDAQNMVGVYEMRGTATGVAAENYRTLNLDTLLGLKAGGKVIGEVAE